MCTNRVPTPLAVALALAMLAVLLIMWGAAIEPIDIQPRIGGA